MDDKIKKRSIIFILATGALGAYGFDPETVTKLLSETAQSQITQAGFFFTLAAWLHAGRVKKEIASQFQFITEAINNVATALRNDLATHAARLDRIENVVFKPSREPSSVISKEQ